MNRREILRTAIRAAVKSGKASLPHGVTLTDVGQRWSVGECESFLNSNNLENESVIKMEDGEKIKASETGKTPAELMAAAMAAMIEQTPVKAIDREAVQEMIDDSLAKIEQPTKTVVVSFAGKPDVDVGAQHSQFEKLLKIVAAISVKNVMLVGPSGSGKTHAAHSMATALGLSYYSMGACIMPSDLLGYKDATGNYHSTQFVECFKNGGVVILDEIDSYSERASLALNEALSNGSMVAGGERIKRHADCIVLAGANTWGNGSTLEFTGRARMDAALLGRFPVKLTWDYCQELEAHICGNEAATLLAKVREKARNLGIKMQITTRHGMAIRDLIAADYSVEDAADMTIYAGITPDQANKLRC